jgi:hypothetical protein
MAAGSTVDPSGAVNVEFVLDTSMTTRSFVQHFGRHGASRNHCLSEKFT